MGRSKIFLQKFCQAFCGFGDDEECKPGLLSGSNGEWSNDPVAVEAREYQRHSKQIQEMETTIREAVRQRQEKHHRMTVFAKQVVASECPLSHPKTTKELAFLRKVLSEDKDFIFCDFNDKEREFMVQILQKDTSWKRRDILWTVGDVGKCFYIIDQGKVDILDGHSSGSITIKTLGRGDSFGEMALLYDVPRSTSARVREDCVLWKMDQHCFRAKLAHHALSVEEEMMGLLRRIPLFEDLDDSYLRKFANSLEKVQFEAEQRIVNKGDVGNMFYIIDEGIVRIHGIGAGDSKYDELEMKAGEFFGERALLTGEPRSAHATAQTDVTVWAVDRETFETSFGPLQGVIEHNMKKRFLRALPIIADSDINTSELDDLATRMKELSMKSGLKLDEVGKPYRQELVIIQHGRIAVYDGSAEKGSQVFILKNGDYYGDKHISDDPGTPSCYNVICEENTTVWSLSKDDLQEVIGEFDRLGRSRPFGKKLSRSVSAYAKQVAPNDLERIKILGRGGFGKVWLVKHRFDGKHYALKELNKRLIIDKKQATNVLREKDILATLNHPFILGHVTSFQDEANLYIVMPVIKGGELYGLIVDTNGKGLPLSHCVFYAACIFSALSHFHTRLIAYRDLKPENVMIDNGGYCVIVDLGFAKVVTTKTFTLCGTPEYLAPEVFMSQGHDKSCDLWSYGVLTYELITGQSAFYRPDEKQVDMFKRIVRTQYEIPSSIDPVSEDLIKRLLVRNPSKRLGVLSGGMRDVRDHAWFRGHGMNWKQLTKREIESPWIPEIKAGSVVSDQHYDTAGGAYRDISFGRPLTAEEQSMFKDF